MSDRWIGFDMDECVGSVMPIYAFLHSIPVDVVVSHLLPALIRSEALNNTWIIRKAFVHSLPTIWSAYRSGNIAGCFIFSNNGSELLVRFICVFINTVIQTQFGLTSMPALFKMGVWSGAPWRPSGHAKNLVGVQNSLAAHGLPILSNIDGLLFFDDMDHELSNEIYHYVKVPPYFYHTPIEKVITALCCIEHAVGSDAWNKICKQAVSMEKSDFVDRGNMYRSEQQMLGEIRKETKLFQKALNAFLDEPIMTEITYKIKKKKTKTRL